MYRYPEKLYTDVRIETVSTTDIGIRNDILIRNKTKTEIGAMIRIYDGKRWYYKAITKNTDIQGAIDELSHMAEPNDSIYENPEIQLLEVNQASLIRHVEDDISKINNNKKLDLVKKYNALTKVSVNIKDSGAFYRDIRKVTHFSSSKGTDIEFDRQYAYAGVYYTIVENGVPTEGFKRLEGVSFDRVIDHEKDIEDEIRKDLDFAKYAKPVLAGDYTCVLSPLVTGVFAHESFGHKSEADFMMSDESMKKEWTIGKKVGSDNLTIIDDGNNEYFGCTPYDDEGCRAKTTYLIKNGILSGRLHNSASAAILGEELTGNARAMNFEFEPIVRMTNTFIAGGTMAKEDLFKNIKEGVFVDTLKHGSGMTTFTLAPSRSYMIRDGKIAEPVRVSVVTGNVMETLFLIDGISSETEIFSGWCGKGEQECLPVGMGGPFIRVQKLKVQ